MACVCVCLLPRLRWPGFSPAVACLAQSQGLHCLYNQASLGLGGRTTMKLSVPVDVCFSVDSSFRCWKLNANSRRVKCILLFSNPAVLWRAGWSNGSTTQTKQCHTTPQLVTARLKRANGDTAYLSVCLPVCVWEAPAT